MTALGSEGLGDCHYMGDPWVPCWSLPWSRAAGRSVRVGESSVAFHVKPACADAVPTVVHLRTCSPRSRFTVRGRFKRCVWASLCTTWGESSFAVIPSWAGEGDKGLVYLGEKARCAWTMNEEAFYVPR
jgi:hypothetical protein